MTTIAFARSGLACLVAVALSACQSHTNLPASVPALMVASATGAQCIAQMQAAVQRPNGGPVVLTPAAFSTEDRLSVVPSTSVLDAAGQPGNGRLLGSPDTFRLTLSQGVCTLVREADGRTSALTACTCVPIR
jgi:hypothetical protein